MIRVGLPALGGPAWQGGRNYLWNLLRALMSLPPHEVQPVLLCHRGEGGDLRLPGVAVAERSGLLAHLRAQRIGSVGRRLFGLDVVEELWLRDAGVDVYSHGRPLGRSRIPWIYWIYDLQHRAHPEFFSKAEVRSRDAAIACAARYASLLVTSNAGERQQLSRLFGVALDRIRVLQFVSGLRVPLASLPSRAALTSRLGLPARYFHLPNQLWKHKNHAVVLDALALAPDVSVVATGAQEDYRHPGLYQALLERAAHLGLGSRFRHLGMVPHDELLALMQHSVAVVNPSLFEGWSSTVEEAKTLGKQVLLSDIPVHREQAPERVRFFAPHDASSLAALLNEALDSVDPGHEAAAQARAASSLPAREQVFGATYLDIVRAAVARPH